MQRCDSPSNVNAIRTLSILFWAEHDYDVNVLQRSRTLYAVAMFECKLDIGD